MAPTVQEYHIQRALVLWYGGEKWKKGALKGQWKVYPAELPGVVWWHTPNNGKREDDAALEGKWLKEMGVKAGVPDLCFLWGRLYCIELKKEGGHRSAAQRDMHPRLIAAGAWVETIDNLEGAKAQLRTWGLVAPGF